MSTFDIASVCPAYADMEKAISEAHAHIEDLDSVTDVEALIALIRRLRACEGFLCQIRNRSEKEAKRLLRRHPELLLAAARGEA